MGIFPGKAQKGVHIRFILNIAGSDSCGGAGTHADIKTIGGLGCHAVTAITAVTAQNSQGVFAIHEVPEGFIALQIETIVKDLSPDAMKIGMLPSSLASCRGNKKNGNKKNRSGSRDQSDCRRQFP